ncbi:hypothetical protein [Flavobacterium maritimum]|uniref:hypothetical protein n=1 Tax=Flavobacterium maritimum TaxID=3149042 RepID=UPI0032B5949F
MKTFTLLSRLFSLLLSLFLIISCSTHKSKLSENNYFLKNYFYNDSLKVGIDFDKNIEFRKAPQVKAKEYKKFLKSKENISSKDLFLVADSKEKGTESYFFYQNIKTSNDSLAVAKIIVHDTITHTILFEKQKGKRKITGLLKIISAKDNQSSLSQANDLLNKITIDSLDEKKLSFPLIFIKYFPSIHPNGLYASKKLKTAPLKAEGDNNPKFQYLSTVNSLMSNNRTYDSLIVDYEKKRKEKFNPMIADLSNKEDVYKDNAVLGKIAEIAKENQVIMLNEDHYYPKHRLFAMELLETLKANGYTYLSLEAFVADSETNFTPNYHNGIYTDEPYFAHFIRKAIALGFIVSGHENHDRNIDREIGQAKNILKILEKDPNAKIFVFVGHGHLEKKYEGRKLMAEHFIELSKINPITINQTVVCADTKNELLLIPRTYLNDTTKTKSTADYFLINNRKPSLKKIYPNAVFKETKIKNTVFSKYKNKEVLVEVIDSKEFALIKNLAIPIESYLKTPKNNEINLELPIGSYHVLVRTEDDETIYDDNLIVN